jgi:hypothetical protein
VILTLANHSLGKGNLWVDSCYTTYGGLTLLTTHVTTQAKINLIATAIQQTLALPMPIATSLPTSQSYLKIVNVPYLLRSGAPISSNFIRNAMGKSHLASSFTLANSPQVM